MDRLNYQGRAVHRYFVVPRPELQAYIDRLWGWECAAQVAMPPMLPGTGAELLFHYCCPFVIDRRSRGVAQLGAAQLLCARRRPYQAQAPGGGRLHRGALPLGRLASFLPAAAR